MFPFIKYRPQGKNYTCMCNGRFIGNKILMGDKIYWKIDEKTYRYLDEIIILV